MLRVPLNVLYEPKSIGSAILPRTDDSNFSKTREEQNLKNFA